jgi:hypothetical protein
MKTKTFLLVCLILGIGLTRLSAQNGKDGTGSYSEWYTNSYQDPVFCEGVLIDWLDLTVTVHHKAHFLKGDWLTCFTQAKGTAVSKNTGENFKIIEIAKQENNVITAENWEWVAIVHFEAMGDRGTHYKGSFTVNYKWEFTGGTTVCH